ncbi:MAG: spore germination protein, partial [Clostridia bacterium]|nr:spore germination protein [Clostridia bacterium]
MADYVKSNLIELKKIFGQDETVIFREFNARQNSSIHYCVVFVDHLVNADQIQNQIIAPLMQTQISEPMENWRMLDFISKEVITISSLTQESELNKIVELILAGNTALFINDFYNALILSTTQWTDRAVDEPSSEKTLFGPREGFTENIDTNLSLIRRRLRTSSLKLEFMQFGIET